MLTLMPVAAFAAAGDFSAPASVFATVDKNAEVQKNEEVDVQISLKNVANGLYTTGSQTVYVWAETVANQPNDAFEAVGFTGEKGVYKVALGANEAIKEFKAKFYRAGEYTLKASVENPLTASKVSDVVLFNGAGADYKKVVVNNTAQETEKWKMNVSCGSVNETLSDDAIAKEPIVVEANGVKTTEVTLTLYAADGKTIVTSYPVTLDTNSSNIEISDTKLTTNHNGQVKFKVAGLREGTYRVYATAGDLDITILVQVGSSIANDIEVIKAPEGPVAKDEKIADYKDVIRFQITDVNNNVVTNTTDNCTKANPTDAIAPYVTILEQPSASKLKDKDIWISQVSGKDYYTLALTSGKQFDVEGTYSVKVILDNGRSAVVTWDVKKFGTPVELKLTYKQEAVELNAIAKMDSLVYVDANGVEKYAKDASLAANGYAIRYFEPNKDAKAYKVGEITTDNGKQDIFAEQGDIVIWADEKYVGSTVKVTAVSERYNLVASTEIKVTADAAELAFASKTAEVNVNNKIDVQIVDANGNKVAPTNVSKTEIYYVILDKPEGAKVTATTSSDSDFASKGKFTMALTSNKVGNVAVQAVAKLTTNAGMVKYYSGTQIFAVGNGSAGDVVVMSIGSNEIVINDKKATIDAAPIVQNDRTYVPFRALAEAFGAEVAYDEATQAVTAELNGVTVVMTIGSATYTVNGAEKTMDVAPFVNGSRTMVPVRFAAEAFGIKVIPTYNPDGTTADILFNL